MIYRKLKYMTFEFDSFKSFVLSSQKLIFLISFIRLLNGAIFSKIDLAIQDVLQY